MVRLQTAMALAAALLAQPAAAEDSATAATNPYLEQPEALATGERLYRARCFGCHFRGGGRGPNVFRSTLPLADFVRIVAAGGRPGMPAWGNLLSGDDILKLHAFLMSRDRL